MVPVAASALSLRDLGGPRRDARVLAPFPTALYLALDRHHEVLPVLTRDALALPTALRVPHVADALRWNVEQGDVVEVGGGSVRLPGMRLSTGRVWHPAPVRPVSPAARARCAVPTGLVGEAVSQALRGLAADLTAAVITGHDLRPGLRGLVGAGAGLTPSGDDAVCGVLLALRALGVLDDRFDRLVAAVEQALPTTTSISASLLVAAADGYALPDVVRLVGAAVTGRPRELAGTLPAVLAVGHSSGADLVAGLLGALDATAPQPSSPSRARRRPPRPHRPATAPVHHPPQPEGARRD